MIGHWMDPVTRDNSISVAFWMTSGATEMVDDISVHVREKCTLRVTIPWCSEFINTEN